MASRIVDKEAIRPVLKALEEAFEICNVNYYLIGALAREVWYERIDRKFTTTKDVDFAVLVGSDKQYEEIRNYLIKEKQYRASADNDYALFTPDNMQVDLLPFGAIEIDGVQLESEGFTNIKINGFREVYDAGTSEVEVIDGYSFEVATPAAIILLKLIAYDDRPERRLKDAEDVANILMNYFELEANLIYEDHVDLFSDTQPNRELDEIAAIVVGRELNKLLEDNDRLKDRVVGILKEFIDKGDKSVFVRKMSQETNLETDKMVKLLSYVLNGLAPDKP